jgi:hypothetical protein
VITAFVGVGIGLSLMLADFTTAGLLFALICLSFAFFPLERR